MLTKIRLIIVASVVGLVAAASGSASAASTPDAKRFHGIGLEAKRFHGAPAGYRGWSVRPEAKRFHGIRSAGGRTGP
jgi:hypothetical protein